MPRRPYRIRNHLQMNLASIVTWRVLSGHLAVELHLACSLRAIILGIRNTLLNLVSRKTRSAEFSMCERPNRDFTS